MTPVFSGSVHYHVFLEQLQAWCSARGLAVPQVLAATKYGDVEALLSLQQQGCTLFGENRVQSAKAKCEDSRFRSELSWHFIGHLQTNKAAEAVRLFSCIQSGDRLSLLEALDFHAGRQHKKQTVFIQVNPAKESTKSGFEISDVYDQHHRLFAFPNLHVAGIMAMVPYTEDPEAVRSYFQMTARLYTELRCLYPSVSVLSMGMSHDYRIAIEEGATMIRIGSLLFEGASV